MDKFTFNNEEWECVDPLSLQFLIPVSEKVFKVRQLIYTSPYINDYKNQPAEIPDEVFNDVPSWDSMTIDLTSMSEETMWKHLKFSISRAEFDILVNEKHYDVLAELIFDHLLLIRNHARMQRKTKPAANE